MQLQQPIRAVLGITFDHDDPVFKDYEKPYTVNWDICPAIVAGDESNGFVEAQFEVHQPPEGRPTDRLPGASRAWLRLKEENPEFSLQTIQYMELYEYRRFLKPLEMELMLGTIRNRDILKDALSELNSSNPYFEGIPPGKNSMSSMKDGMITERPTKV